ncbi:tetratricopeptide repeat protein, partial [Limnofasciculus baicalensis]
MLQENEPVAISAMGGIGKTELALQYALRYSQIDVGAKHFYRGGVCWLLARGLDLGIQIVDFARVYLGLNPPEDFDLQQRVAYCWRNWHYPPNPPYQGGDKELSSYQGGDKELSSYQGGDKELSSYQGGEQEISSYQGREQKIFSDVLVVIDDVIDYEKVKPYLPREARFKVLMTTRLELPAPIVRLDLQVLTGEAALDLLKSLIGEERVGAELEVGENICKWLGYLPLGLELVGRYLMRKLDLSLAEMLSRLEAKQLQQLGLKKPKSEATMTGQLGVRDAFELSWLELNKSGQELGLYLSLFALAPIPWQLVEECLPDIDSEELEETRDYSLVYFHLIQRSEKDTYQLHPLIREFLIAKGEELGIADDWKQRFCQVMVGKAEKIPQTPTLEDIEKVNLAIPHIAAAATTQQDWLRDDDLIWPFVALGRFYEGKGFYQEAVPWREDCLSVTRKRLGENHPDVATSLNNLALLYDNQGRYDEAEPLYKESLE